MLRLGALLLLALLVGAQARPESAAATLRPDVMAVGHTPALPEPGQQFTVTLQLAPNSTVEAVQVQVCIINLIVCIIPPRNATMDDVWQFDTATFTPVGTQRPYPWPAGARIGVQWFLDGAPFPPNDPPLDAPACDGREMECYADHYFEFSIAAGKDTPLPWALVLVALALAWRRHG